MRYRKLLRILLDAWYLSETDEYLELEFENCSARIRTRVKTRATDIHYVGLFAVGLSRAMGCDPSISLFTTGFRIYMVPGAIDSIMLHSQSCTKWNTAEWRSFTEEALEDEACRNWILMQGLNRDTSDVVRAMVPASLRHAVQATEPVLQIAGVPSADGGAAQVPDRGQAFGGVLEGSCVCRSRQGGGRHGPSLLCYTAAEEHLRPTYVSHKRFVFISIR